MRYQNLSLSSTRMRFDMHQLLDIRRRFLLAEALQLERLPVEWTPYASYALIQASDDVSTSTTALPQLLSRRVLHEVDFLQYFVDVHVANTHCFLSSIHVLCLDDGVLPRPRRHRYLDLWVLPCEI